jgi:hypothetical protein
MRYRDIDRNNQRAILRDICREYTDSMSANTFRFCGMKFYIYIALQHVAFKGRSCIASDYDEFTIFARCLSTKLSPLDVSRCDCETV